MSLSNNNSNNIRTHLDPRQNRHQYAPNSSTTASSSSSSSYNANNYLTSPPNSNKPHHHHHSDKSMIKDDVDHVCN